jgi:2-succinyl-5-enolpyruvyl-6-hydroxy-3-cyclohexene-1-carboxylate synthase
MQNRLFYYRWYGFLYDSNALWNNYIPKNFKIIVINNGGGGILEFYPDTKKVLF